MRKESSTVQKCKRQMATLGFDSQLAYHRVKLILKIYRDVVWVLSERVEELHEYAWELGAQDADTGLIYLQSFAPDMDLQEFEERVCCVIENRMLVDVIDRALLRLKRYPPQMIHGGVGRQLIQPRGKPALAPKAGQPSPRRQKRLLGHLLGVLRPAAAHAQRQPVHRCLIRPHQLLKGGRVPATGLRHALFLHHGPRPPSLIRR